MSDMYAIKGSTLTALGDAVRNKTNATRYGPHTELRQEITKKVYAGDTSLYEIYVDKEYDKIGLKVIEGDAIIYDGWSNPVTPDENGECFIEGWNIFSGGDRKWYEITIRNLGSEGNITIEAIPYDGNVLNTMTLSQMTEEINNITAGPTAEELTFTGNCQYRFRDSGWDWFIHKYENLITTKDITDGRQMFTSATNLVNIPFDINFKKSAYYVDISGMFSFCQKLETVPKLLNLKVGEISDLFAYCYVLKEVPDNLCDTWDWTYLDSRTGAYECSGDCVFQNCYSLRKFPMTLFQHGNPYANYSSAIWNNSFNGCYCLDEIVGLPNPHYSASYTSGDYSSPFRDMVKDCRRLKRFTFAPMDPPKWSNQILDFSYSVGYGHPNNYIGQDAPRITDDATYQEYKDHPDCWTSLIEYSRYNRISAVETINSLPDTSTTGTANSIKFKGASGSLTDGGAINTMTDEEIAVAAAKGWTVVFA